jgi:hypothetical protein
MAAASRVSHSIASNNYAELPTLATKGLRTLWKKLHSKSWTLSFTPDGNGIAAALISPDIEILSPNLMRGRTTVYGTCEMVGGAKKQSMRIRLLTGESCSIGVKSKPLAKQIAQRLHTVIGVDGEAWWDTHTLKMQKFVADSLLEYEPASPAQTFAELAKSADGFWDNIDPDEYVKELRSD